MNWKKWLSLAGGAIIVLIFLAYLIFTSSFFLKRVALPIAGNFLKMEIKADSIDLDGLSKISIQNLKLTPNNEETILEAAEIQISLSSFSSPISIEEVFLDKASINIVQTPDGGNLAAVLALFSAEEEEKAPLELSLVLKNLIIQNSSVKWRMIGEDDSLMGAELKNINLTGKEIGNELNGKVSLQSILSFFMGSDCKAVPENLLSGALAADLTVPLTKEFMPGIISGGINWGFSETDGMFNPLHSHGIDLDVALSLEQIQKLVLNINKGEEQLGNIVLNGNINLSDLGGEFNYDINGVDSRLLNAFIASPKVKLDQTFISTKGSLKVYDLLNNYAIKSQTKIQELTLILDEPSPAISLESDLDLEVDLTQQLMRMNKLYAKGVIGNKEFISTELTDKLVISWAKDKMQTEIPDASFQTKFNFDLAAWEQTGLINSIINIAVKEQGTKVELVSLLKLEDVDAFGYQATGEINLENIFSVMDAGCEFAGRLDVKDLTLGRGELKLQELAFNSNHKIGISREPAIYLQNFNIAFKATDKASNKISMAGKLDMHDYSNLSFLNIDTDGVDLTPVLRWTKGLMAKLNTISAIENESLSQEAELITKKSVQEDTHSTITGINLPVKNFESKISMKHIYAEMIHIENFDLDLSIKTNDLNLTINPMKVLAGETEGSIELASKVNLEDLSVGLTYNISGIDENILNELLPVDFYRIQKVLISSKGNIQVSNSLQEFHLGLQSDVKDLLIENLNTQSLSLDSDFDLNLNLAKGTVLAEKLDFSTLLGTKEILSAGLTKPLSFSWTGGENSQINDSNWKVVFNLSADEWKALLSDPNAKGSVTGLFNLNVTESGRELTFNGNIGIDALSAGGYSASGNVKADGILNKNANDYSFTGLIDAGNFMVQGDMLDIKDFSAKTEYEFALDSEIFDIRKLVINWSPTYRAKNEIQFTGSIAYSDLSKPSRINIAAESLDFTPQLSWLKSSAQPTELQEGVQTNALIETPVASASQDHSLPLPKTEPEAIDFPVKDFECNIDLGVAYLQEMFMSNVTMGVFAKTNVVSIEIDSINLNGGDATAQMSLDLGKKGYIYSLNYDAPSIPVAPIFDFLQSDLPSEISEGSFYAVGSINGSGVTEASIQKNLNFHTIAGLTNIVFKPINATYQVALKPILAVLRVSELVSAPILGVQADVEGMNGNLTINSARVITDSFEADVTGDIEMNSVLMDSPLNLPVTFYLEEGIAKRSNMTLTQAKTNSVGFLAMPQFVTIKGTPAEWKIDLKETVITGLLLKSGVGAVSDVGSTADKIVGNIGGLLIGDTNNTNGVKGIVQGVGELVGIRNGNDTNTVDNDSTTNNTSTNNIKKHFDDLINIFKNR